MFAQVGQMLFTLLAAKLVTEHGEKSPYAVLCTFDGIVFTIGVVLALMGKLRIPS